MATYNAPGCRRLTESGAPVDACAAAVEPAVDAVAAFFQAPRAGVEALGGGDGSTMGRFTDP